MQGPSAVAVLSELAPEVARLNFMQGCSAMINDCACFVTRSGYTGEDGFEISIKPQDCHKVADILLANKNVRWVGLGARDSLRLEAGLCLYGHDMDNNHANRGEFIVEHQQVQKRGRAKTSWLLGSDTVLKHIKDGIEKKRVGFIVEERAPVREGAEIVDKSGTVIGIITSGGFSPSLQQPIAMGYIATKYSSTGTQVNALVRGKSRPLVVSSMPFVPQRYYRG